jgi:hypothetical protein
MVKIVAVLINMNERQCELPDRSEQDVALHEEKYPSFGDLALRDQVELDVVERLVDEKGPINSD